MTSVKLSSSDLKHLINRYEADLRQLHFQIESTKHILHDLREALPQIESEEIAQATSMVESAAPVAEIVANVGAAAPAKKGSSGKKAKSGAKKGGAKAAKAGGANGATAAAAAAAEAEAEAEKKKGYRLSEIDQLIMEALESEGKALINAEMQDYIENKKKAAGESFDSDEISVKISRSLQKLANRRDDLVKVPFEGRGKAYALPNWVNPDGNLKNKYSR